MAGPLHDLQIIEMGHVIAGPLAATLLADFGADVIKIEQPGGGDMMRDLGLKSADGVGAWWKTLARNKRMLALDWKSTSGQKVLRKLVEKTDVLIENFRPGVLERAGIGPDVLHEWNPDLTILRISGYGQDGPMKKVPAFGRAAEAMSGLAHLTGYADGPPMHPGFPTADTTTGLMGALGIMIALHGVRNGTSRGQVVDLAVFETLLRLIDYPVPVVTGVGASPRRNGFRQPLDFVPAGMFQTRDGMWITISAGGIDTAKRLLWAVGGDALAEDPRFATMEGIVAEMEEIISSIEKFVAAREYIEVDEAFKKADAVAAPVLSIEEIMAHPQIAHRGDIVSIDGEKTRVIAPIPHLSATPGEVNWLGRELGADSIAVLREAGLSDEEINSMIDEGVVGSGGNEVGQ